MTGFVDQGNINVYTYAVFSVFRILYINISINVSVCHSKNVF